MKVFCHQIYEYKKGLRHLALCTLSASFLPEVKLKLDHQDIDYIVRLVSEDKVNVFFGDKECINIISEIGNKKLNEYTPEEDFILGVMLGYDRIQQCKRFMKQKEKERAKNYKIREFDARTKIVRV